MPLPYDFHESGIDMESGSHMDVESGAYVDIESGGELRLAGTALTSNAGEINSLDGVATTWQTKVLGTPTITVGGEAANSINVAVQMKDITGTNIAESLVVMCYLSDASTGDGIAGTAPDGDIAIGTDGTILFEHTADKVFVIWTESDGQFDVDIGESGADTWYLVIVQNGGTLAISDAITFAA